ncbi:MAG: hypothetical protein JWO59_252 [Chloroflexi bacterium]|nr:hypothetical protein [Chloroflexota bacterium]
MSTDELTAPPGASLRDPAYQDLCGFFATFPEGKDWVPQFGDWVVVPPSQQPLLVLAHNAAGDQLSLAAGAGEEPGQQPRSACVWLPTLDQLRALIREHFGTTGFFSSTFNDSTYWYTGQMLGMTVTNMQPLAEGKSPEEAALKALLMKHQW